MKRYTAYLIPVFLFTLSACNSSRTVVDSTPTVIKEGPTEWSQVEKVDMSDYPDQPVGIYPGVEHDVPEILMTSSADDGVIEEVDGYRIQIFSSLERSETVKVEDEVRLWLSSLTDDKKEALAMEKDVEVYSFYRQPYYRVRVGDFHSREDAALLVAELSTVFPGALIVPDLIIARR